MIYPPGVMVRPNRAKYPVRGLSMMHIATTINPDFSISVITLKPVGNAEALGIVVASRPVSVVSSDSDKLAVYYIVFPRGVGWVFTDHLEFL